jgi:hypothetical protein
MTPKNEYFLHKSGITVHVEVTFSLKNLRN